MKDNLQPTDEDRKRDLEKDYDRAIWGPRIDLAKIAAAAIRRAVDAEEKLEDARDAIASIANQRLKAEEKLKGVRGILEELQWSGDDSLVYATCPSCRGRSQEGHKDWCVIAEALKD